jgi:hypothetical protein
MSDFKDIAHKTVAELFDMLKEKQYTVDALSEINHEKDLEIADLKAQLNNMETCYIEKKKERDELQKTNISLEAGLRKNSKNKQKLLGKNIELQKRIDEALVIIEKHSRYIPFSAEQAIREALRGGS